MAKDTVCPICDADLLFAGDESRGDTVICAYCGSPFTVKDVGSDEQEWGLEEDF